MPGFRKSFAFVIGVDAYAGGVAPLSTAVVDVRAVGRELARAHGYELHERLDQAATRAGLQELLGERLPQLVGPEDRALIYFAGHGVALDGEGTPQGYLIPQDARADAPETWLAMGWVHETLAALPCRHLLLVLDCCFAGAFRWSNTRSFIPRRRTMHRASYRRFQDGRAWQVLTSSAHDQRALDVLSGMTIGARRAERGHSPFAAAMLDALRGGADRPGPSGRCDGVITATELYAHVRDVVEVATVERGGLQTPGLWSLPKHGRGEFLFRVPERALELEEDPALDEAANPWRGLDSYGPEDAALFFGRATVVRALRERVERAPGGGGEGSPLVLVVGASGTGKSSVVKAGLVPLLRAGADAGAGAVRIVGPARPGARPLELLTMVDAALAEATPGRRVVAVIDQLEECFTMCRDPQARAAFFAGLERALVEHEARLLVIATTRADFEPQLRATAIGARIERARFVIPALTPEELREVIEGPAEARALFFEPPSLVDALVHEVAGTPGALPLLSFALAELYRVSIARGDGDRTLREREHQAMGGVVGALRSRADALLEASTPAVQATIRALMLRMVAGEGGDLARRRVELRELDFEDPEENARVSEALERMTSARLLVRGAGVRGGARELVEPAHDALVRAWGRVHAWLDEHGERLALQRACWRQATFWHDGGRPRARLWHDDPRLPQLLALQRELAGGVNRIEGAFLRASAARQRWRARVTVTVVSAVIVTLAALAFASWRLYLGEREQERRARAEAVAARRAEAASRDAARVTLASSRDDATVAAALLREVESPSTTRGWRSAALAVLAEPIALAVLEPADARDPAPLVAAALSSDGARVVTRTSSGRCALWRPPQPEPTIFACPLVQDDRAGALPSRALMFTPDGDAVVAAHPGGLRWWPLASMTPIDALHGAQDGAAPGPMIDLAFAQDGARAAALFADGSVSLWSLSGAAPPQLVWRAGPTAGARGDSAALSFGVGGALAVARGGALELLRPGSGALEMIRDSVYPAPGSLTVNSARGRALSLGAHGDALMLEDHAFALLGSTRSFDVHAAAVHRSGERWAVVDQRGALTLVVRGARDPAETRRARLPDPGGTLSTLRFSADGSRIAAGAEDGRVMIWSGLDALAAELQAGVGNINNGTVDRGAAGVELLTLGRHDAPISALAFDGAGARLVSASLDASARLWSTAGAPPRRRRLGALASLRAPDHRHYCVSRSPIAVTEPLRAPGLRFSRDGAHLIAVGPHRNVTVWPVARGELEARSRVLGPEDSNDHCVPSRYDGDRVARVELHPGGNHMLVRTRHGELVEFEIRGHGDSDAHRYNSAAELDELMRGKLGPRFTPRVLAAGYTRDGEGVVRLQADGALTRWPRGGGAEELVAKIQLGPPGARTWPLPPREGEPAPTRARMAPGAASLLVADGEGARVLAVGAGGWSAAIEGAIAIDGQDDLHAMFSRAGEALLAYRDAPAPAFVVARADRVVGAPSPLGAPPDALALSPDGRALAACNSLGELVIGRVGEDGELSLTRRSAHGAPVASLRFAGSGRWLAAGSASGALRLW